ncbi:MAG TPA: C39 family peptidase [Micromonosporaceae bacterium]
MARPRPRALVRTGITVGITALALVSTTAPAQAGPTRSPEHDEQITYQDWSTFRDWSGGSHAGTLAVDDGRAGLTMGSPAGTTDYTDPHTGLTRTWSYATWTSPVTQIGFAASELVASWNAETPAGTWIQIEMQGTYNTGGQTPWYVMGRWAAGDQDIKRTSVNGQGDPWSTIWTDTFSIDDVNNGVMLRAYQLRLTLYRAPEQQTAPRVWTLGAMSSYVPDRFTVTPSAGGIAWGTELSVPRYSQDVHKNHYKEYDGGGEAWCSPTSTEMVVEYWGRGPSAADTSWVNPKYPDPTVNHAARMVYDYAYQGAGNWPFNTAYAASFPGLEAKVTRLHSLDELEHFIAAGIPVVTSQSFLETELDGAGYGTSGHLFVVVGFTPDGDVVVNDPASPSNDAVRHVYLREQFEQVWLRTKRTNAKGGVSGGSGGIAYLIKPLDRPWPEVAGSTNW